MSNPILGSPYRIGLPHWANPTKIEEWESPLTIFAAGGNRSFQHNLSGRPDITKVFLHCISAEHGYGPGAEVEIDSYQWSNNATGQSYGVGIYLSGETTIGYQIGDTGTFVIPSLSGIPGDAVTPSSSNWRLIIKAYKFTIGDIVSSIKTVDIQRLETKIVNNGDADVQFNLAQYFNEHESFQIDYKGVGALTDSTTVRLRTSTDEGSTFNSGISDYQNCTDGVFNNTPSGSSAAATYIRMAASNLGTANNFERVDGTLTIYNAEDPNNKTSFISQNVMRNSDGHEVLGQTGGYREALEITTDIQFSASSGNLAQGTFILYGKRRAA